MPRCPSRMEDYRLPDLPRYVRINTLLTSRSAVEKRLKESGHFYCPDPKHPGNRSYFRSPDVPDLLVFKPKGQSDISRIPMIASGEVVVQQLASCFPALALAPPPGAWAIDGCAAPGNKTSHLAALMRNKGRVFAFEINERRCNLLQDMMKTKGVSIVLTKHASFLDASPTDPEYSKVSHVLLDPSCSSSGMSRTPETDPERLRELAQNQLTLVLHAMRFPAVEAVVYSTCSMLQTRHATLLHATSLSPCSSELPLRNVKCCAHLTQAFMRLRMRMLCARSSSSKMTSLSMWLCHGGIGVAMRFVMEIQLMSSSLDPLCDAHTL